MKSLVKKKLEQLGYVALKVTDRKLLDGLVRSLTPQDVGVELIRIGGANDGGYLVPDDLAEIAACFSPGVDVTASFEADLMERGIRSFLADYSVDGPPPYLEGCEFTKKFVGSISSENTISIDDWVNASLPDSDSSDLLLQMDIEGAEYEALLATSSKTLQRFRIIVIEFHRLGELAQRPLFDFVQMTINKILKYFDVVHLHPNNAGRIKTVNGIEFPVFLEITFLRKDRGHQRIPKQSFPHKLDAPNLPLNNDIELPAIWYTT